MTDEVTRQLMFATDLWANAMKTPTQVERSLILMRGDKEPVTYAPMCRHDVSDANLLRAGVIPIVAPSVENAKRRLRPLWANLGVTGAVLVARATALMLDDPANAKQMILLWSHHLGTDTEVNWAREILPDGSVSGPLDLTMEIVGNQWIKAALS